MHHRKTREFFKVVLGILSNGSSIKQLNNFAKKIEICLRIILLIKSFGQGMQHQCARSSTVNLSECNHNNMNQFLQSS